MAVNEFSFNQIATILNQIQQQATGQIALTPTNTYEFVTVATTLLKTGYDPILNAINQLLSRTIFSIRPYTRKFNGINVSETQWGNHVRKLNIADRPVSDDDKYKWPIAYDSGETPPNGDGESVDQYIIRKPIILQTNFYGSNVFEDWYTVTADQLTNAFTGPEQLGQFMSMVSQNMVDKLEQNRENLARATVVNFMAGIIDENNPDRVVHLITEYNAVTGLTLDAQTVYQPDNYKAFMQWVYARIGTISRLMTERSIKFQTVVDNYNVMKHTQATRQKVYTFAPIRLEIDALALSNTFHDNYLRYADTELVNFWQSIDTTDTISVTPSYIGEDGLVKTGSAVVQDHVFGVIFDEEALGYATTQQNLWNSPFNARAGYTNYWFHETIKLWNDHTEKGVVLLLD